jgi:hypothetical protein
MYPTKFGTSRPSHKSCHFAANISRTYKYFKLYAHSTQSRNGMLRYFRTEIYHFNNPKKNKKNKLLTVTELTTLSLFNLLLSLFFIFLFFQFSCKIIIINSNSWLSRKKIWLLKRYCLFLHFKNIFNKI